jgi:hypothetical protein
MVFIVAHEISHLYRGSIAPMQDQRQPEMNVVKRSIARDATDRDIQKAPPGATPAALALYIIEFDAICKIDY